MLEYDKKIVKIFLPIVWLLVIGIPLFLVISNIYEYNSFRNSLHDEKNIQLNSINQVYISELLTLDDLNSIKNEILKDTTLNANNNRLRNKFENIEKDIIKHTFLIDSINNNNLEFFEGKMDSLNKSIDLYNIKASKMNEAEINFELKTNIFYSLVMLIIALTTFLGYRSFVNIKSNVKDEAIEEARKTTKCILNDDLQLTIMDLVRKENFISESWSDFEKTMEDKFEEFRSSIKSDMDSSDSAKISILEENVNIILKKLDELNSDKES